MVIDSTHNTNQYKCKLITISVIDPENNRGYPSVFCISSHENSKALIALWKTIQVHYVQIINLDWFWCNRSDSLILNQKSFCQTTTGFLGTLQMKRLIHWLVDIYAYGMLIKPGRKTSVKSWIVKSTSNRNHGRSGKKASYFRTRTRSIKNLNTCDQNEMFSKLREHCRISLKNGESTSPTSYSTSSPITLTGKSVGPFVTEMCQFPIQLLTRKRSITSWKGFILPKETCIWRRWWKN